MILPSDYSSLQQLFFIYLSIHSYSYHQLSTSSATSNPSMYHSLFSFLIKLITYFILIKFKPVYEVKASSMGFVIEKGRYFLNQNCRKNHFLIYMWSPLQWRLSWIFNQKCWLNLWVHCWIVSRKDEAILINPNHCLIKNHRALIRTIKENLKILPQFWKVFQSFSQKVIQFIKFIEIFLSKEKIEKSSLIVIFRSLLEKTIYFEGRN